MFIFRHFEKLHSNLNGSKVPKRLVQAKYGHKASMVEVQNAKEQRTLVAVLQIALVNACNCMHCTCTALDQICSHLNGTQRTRREVQRKTIKNSLWQQKRVRIYIIAVIISYFNVRLMHFSFILFGVVAFASLIQYAHCDFRQCILT